MPHRARLDDDAPAELGFLRGFDDDVTAQIAAAFNRIRGLPTEIRPASDRPWARAPEMAERLLSLHHQRDAIAAQRLTLVEAHPHHKVLTSMPASWSGSAPAF